MSEPVPNSLFVQFLLIFAGKSLPVGLSQPEFGWCHCPYDCQLKAGKMCEFYYFLGQHVEFQPLKKVKV